MKAVRSNDEDLAMADEAASLPDLNKNDVKTLKESLR